MGLTLGLIKSLFQGNGASGGLIPISIYAGSQVPYKTAPSAPYDTYARATGLPKIYVAAATGTWTDGRYGTSVTLGLGNDSTGNGSALTPYATIQKALNVAAASGSEIIVAPGTYTENNSSTNGFIPRRFGGSRSGTQPTAYTTVRSLTLNGVVNTGAIDVIVTAPNTITSGLIYCSSTNGWGYVDWWGLNFTMPSGTSSNLGIVRFNSTASTNDYDNIRFDTCTFTLAAVTGQRPNILEIGSDNFPNNLQFVGCTFIGIANTTCSIMNASLFTSGGNPGTGFKMLYCNLASGFQGTWTRNGTAGGFTSPMIIGNDFGWTDASPAGHGIMLGQDNVYSATVRVTEPYVAGNYVNHPSHGLIMGGGVSGGTVERNRIRNFGLHVAVSKEQTQNTSSGPYGNWRHNFGICGGSGQLSGLYNKSSLYVGWFENLIYCSGSSAMYGLREGLGSDGSPFNKSGYSSYLANRIVWNNTNASSNMVFYDIAANSQGNSQANYNVYEVRTNANGWGSVRGTSVTSLATLQAAWASAGVGTETTSGNDGNSIVHTNAPELGTFYTSGATVYAIIERNDGYVWTGAGFEAFRPLDASQFAFWLYEQSGGTCRYSRRAPWQLPLGSYKVRYYALSGNLPLPVGYVNRNGLTIAAADTLISVEPLLVSQ